MSNKELIEKASKKINKFPSGTFLIVSIPKNYKSNKIMDIIEEFKNNYNIINNNIIMMKDEFNNTSKIIMLLVKKYENEILSIQDFSISQNNL